MGFAWIMCVFFLTHTALTAIFQVNLDKPVVLSVALTGSWGCHKVLEP